MIGVTLEAFELTWKDCCCYTIVIAIVRVWSAIHMPNQRRFFLCVAFWIRGVVPRANVGIQASQTPVGCLGRLEGMQNDPISSV